MGPRCHSLLLACALAGATALPTTAEDLTSGELLIRGAALEVFPATQEIDPGRPTVVHTRLGDLGPAQVPAGLRVEGELSGPGLDSPLHLSTVPGEPFQVPGLQREGSYTLGGIRLVEGGRIVLAAQPTEVEILVHRLVIASVTSRLLTPEEIAAHGIVIDDSSYSAYRYTVGFATESGTYEIPFDLLFGPDGYTALPSQDAYQLPVPSADQPDLPVPQVVPATLEIIEPPDVELPPPGSADRPTIPGFLVIPTDISFLHQFFSVILVVSNGALAGSPIELRDLAAVLELEGDGVRQASTEPPTVPGEPLPVMDPGPDQEVGTADDLTFLVAQASGEASWLIEGLEEGRHLVVASLTGQLHGLAAGQPVPVAARIPGVVVVRDPRFAMTFFHPWTVRAGEPYTFRVVVANTSITPVYDLSLTLPASAISGAELIGEPERSVSELLPGQAATVTWDLDPLVTGRVVASAFNTSGPIDASFRFEVGVGELGIPLSPESLVLPPAVQELPPEVVESALELLGLAYSLATAPAGAEVDLPPVGESVVVIRGQELAAAATRFTLGEPLQRALVGFGLEWLGSSSYSDSFDALRRASTRGSELEAHLANALAARMDELDPPSALAELEELAITGRPTLIVAARGAGYDGSARLKLVGLASGRAASGQRADSGWFARDLAGAAILEVNADSWTGEVGVVALPLGEDGSWLEPVYQLQLLGTETGVVDLEAVIVTADGSTRRVTIDAIPTGLGSLAILDLSADAGTTMLWFDPDGDGFNVQSQELTIENEAAPAPTVMGVSFTSRVQGPDGGPYSDLLLLLSQRLDTAALAALDPSLWSVSSLLDLPGAPEPFNRPRQGLRLLPHADPRVLTVTCSAPLNPHAALVLSSGPEGLPFLGGGTAGLDNLPVSVSGGLVSGAVRGVVVGSNGLPLAGAVVELYEYLALTDAVEGRSWLLSLADRVSTGAEGGFTLDAVRFRDGQIPFRYASFLLRAVDPASGHETRAAARLAGDNDLRQLSLFMVGRGDVVGTLERADGLALERPEVHARSVANPSEYAAVAPAADGSFRLADLPVGPVQLLARDGQLYTMATAVVPGPGQEARVALVLPEDGHQPLAEVDGQVLDGATAEPVAGVQVFAVPEGSSAATHLAVSEADGGFAMAGVPAGLTSFRVWDPVRSRYVGQRTVELLGDAVNRVQVLTGSEPLAAVTGTVYRQTAGARTPLPGAWVMVRAHGAWTVTDLAGTYRLEDLPLGTVAVEAYDPASDEAVQRTVSLTAPGQVLVVDLDLVSASGSIRATVLDRNSVPVAGARVAAGRFNSGHECVTDSTGSCLLERLTPGVWEVLAHLQQGSSDTLGRASTSVLYAGHEATAVITVGGTVSLQVQTVAATSGGDPNPVLAEIGFKYPGITSSGRIGLVPEEGLATCPSQGAVSCAVLDVGLVEISGLPEGVGMLAVTASNPFYGTAYRAEDLDLGDQGKLLTVSFSAPGVLAGRVQRLDASGAQPVAGAKVGLWVSGQEGAPHWREPQYSAADGSFSFDLIPAGSFSVRAWDGVSGGLAWVDGRISSGEAITGLELNLRGSAALAGRVEVCGGSPPEQGEGAVLELQPQGVPVPFLQGETIQSVLPRSLQLTLDASGAVDFAFSNLALATWSLRVTSAVHGAALRVVEVGPEGATVTLAEPVCLAPAGTVSGTVVFPENQAPAPSVTVQLHRSGTPPEMVAADVTDSAGGFAFASIPVGARYEVRAYDAASNRGGASGWVELCSPNDPDYGSTCWLDVATNVALAPLGAVAGVVRDGDGAGLGNAQVRIRTNVVVNETGEVIHAEREWIAFTAPDGAYRFDGVPAGAARVEAYDSGSPLWAHGTVEVDPLVASTTSLDLDLPGAADLTLRVLDPSGQPLDGGTPVVGFRQSSWALFREPSGEQPEMRHLADGQVVTFADVVADRWRAAACLGDCAGLSLDQLLGHDFGPALGGALEGWMVDPPQASVADLRLVARADFEVTVVQGAEPVEGAEVTVSGVGFYGSQQVVTNTGDGGAPVLVGNLGAGAYSVYATWRDPAGNAIGGVTEVEIAAADHGTVKPVLVSLEEAGAVTGRVLTSLAEPAAGALVTMTLVAPGGTRRFQAVVAAGGDFAFAALPTAPDYVLEAVEDDGPGRYRVAGVEVPVQGVNLGDILLDDRDPALAGVIPVNGAEDVNEGVVLVLDLSEPMRHATLTPERVRLRRAGDGAAVGSSLVIDDLSGADGPFTRVTLSPHIQLASDTLYVVDVLAGAEDLAGRTLSFDAHSTFHTRDSLGPVVLAVDPPDDPTGVAPVGPDVIPVVSFNEPLDAASVSEATVWLEDQEETVVPAVGLEPDGFDVRLVPPALTLGATYTIHVAGVTDTSGNPLPAPWQSSFRVRDSQPPVVTLLLPDGAIDAGGAWSAHEGEALILRAAVLSNDALASVLFLVDGVALGQASYLPGADLWVLAYTTPVGVGQVTLAAVAEDVSGNVSAVASHLLAIVDDLPPYGSMTLTPSGAILPNHELGVTVEAHDDRGLEAAHLVVSGALEASETLALSGVNAVAGTAFRLPATAAAGSQAVVACELEDDFGQRTPLPPQAVGVLADVTPPSVVLGEPLPVEPIEPGTPVQLFFQLEDDVVVVDQSLIVGGDQLYVTVSGVEEPGQTWAATASATWQSHSPEDGSNEVQWTFTAADSVGNQGSATGTLTLEPSFDENAPQISFVCPLDGDACAPGVAMTLTIRITDTDGGQPGTVAAYVVKVDGLVMAEDTQVGLPDITIAPVWTPPAGAVGGDTFLVEVEAWDAGGKPGTGSMTLNIPYGEIKTAGGDLPSSLSGDVTLAGGTYTATGPLDLASLTLVKGANLQGQNLVPLAVTTSGEVRVQCGGRINVSGQGYSMGVTYPGETIPSSGENGGSHMGHGGVASGSPGSTYGSVFRPMEAGAGGGANSWSRGGGVVRIVASSVVVDGDVYAIGAGGGGNDTRGGGGGSIWITTDAISGIGQIQALGGASDWHGGGGGGAIAVEYASATGDVLQRLSASVRPASKPGGAGTVYQFEVDRSTYGDLLVDNRGVGGEETVLPSLGFGVAQLGSAGGQLITSEDSFQPYFEGHWVEVEDPVAHQLKGRWRIAAISGGTLTLEGNTPYGNPNVVKDDLWRGVYLFDSVTLLDGAVLSSDDPILATTATLGSVGGASSTMGSPLIATGAVHVLGEVLARSIHAGDLVVENGGFLSHPPIEDPAHSESLILTADNSVVVEEGGVIDVSGQGYAMAATYPGETIPGSSLNGGSHMGYGGVVSGSPGSTYGSVYRPMEAGAGGGANIWSRGAGVVRIVASSVVVDGGVYAIGWGGGLNDTRGGAGGSIWITTDAISGIGQMQALGGDSEWNGGGGGGAIAIEYGSTTGDLLQRLSASVRPASTPGGAGTILLSGPDSTCGDLLVDNEGVVGSETVLPSLGAGTAGWSDETDVLETGRSQAIPDYFVGHWVQVTSATDGETRSWRITEILEGSETAVRLAPNSEFGSPYVTAGDAWRGVYRFDSVSVVNEGELLSNDPIEICLDPLSPLPDDPSGDHLAGEEVSR